jgi:hypothetical protein
LWARWSWGNETKRTDPCRHLLLRCERED